MKIKYTVFHRRFILTSTFFLTLIALGWNMILHFVILKKSTISIWCNLRHDLTDLLWISILAVSAITCCFTISFLKWRKNGTIKETLLHSLFFSVIIIFAVFVNQYILYDIPFVLILKWSLSALLEYACYGLLLCFFYNKCKKIEDPEGEREL